MTIKLMVFAALACFTFNCAYRINQYALINDIYDPETQLTTRIMTGNNLPLTPIESFKLVKVSLDPGYVTPRKGASYCFLKLVCVYRNEADRLNPGDSLYLQMDDRKLILVAYAKTFKEQETDFYYAIDKLDLMELGDSKSVHIALKGENFDFDKKLDEPAIKNFKKFSTRVILSQKPVYPQRKKIKKAFLGMGKGKEKGYQVLAGIYTNLMKDKLSKGTTDFIVMGFGRSSFYYDKFVLTEYPSITVPGYVYQYFAHRVSQTYRLTSGLGVSCQKDSWIFSIETALLFNYYFPRHSNWDRYIPIETESGTYPYFINTVTHGRPYRGFALGVFLQAGPVWYQTDTKGVWTIGLSIPLKL